MGTTSTIPAPTVFDLVYAGPLSIHTMAAIWVDLKREVMQPPNIDNINEVEFAKRCLSVVGGAVEQLNPDAQAIFWSYVKYLAPDLDRFLPKSIVGPNTGGRALFR